MGQSNEAQEWDLFEFQGTEAPFDVPDTDDDAIHVVEIDDGFSKTDYPDDMCIYHTTLAFVHRGRHVGAATLMAVHFHHEVTDQYATMIADSHDQLIFDLVQNLSEAIEDSTFAAGSLVFVPAFEIAPDCRGQGFAAKALEAMEHWLSGKGNRMKSYLEKATHVVACPEASSRVHGDFASQLSSRLALKSKKHPPAHFFFL